jgi:hypothetical protein
MRDDLPWDQIFCLLDCKWQRHILTQLRHHQKVVILKSVGLRAGIADSELDYASDEIYIDDALLAYSTILIDIPSFNEELLQKIVSLFKEETDSVPQDDNQPELNKNSSETKALPNHGSSPNRKFQKNEKNERLQNAGESLTRPTTYKEKLTPSYNYSKNSGYLSNKTVPSLEQQAALDLCDSGLIVNSFAGTGKTTLASHIVDKLGHSNTIYAAFLRENREEAKERVTSQAFTQDALAVQHALKHSPFASSFDPNDMKKFSESTAVQIVLGLPNKLDIGSKIAKYYTLSRLVQDTVYNYCNSIDNSLQPKHVPVNVISPQAIEAFVNWGNCYWEFLISRHEHDNHIIKFHHLMKFWSLRPDIQLPYELSNIIVDEAQDTNGAFFRVMQNHADRNLIVIGDRHQQLFKWRGAVNTMNLFNLPKRYLTISRRFGESIAIGANNVLAMHSEPPVSKVGGNTEVNSEIIFYQPDEVFPGQVGAILTRTRTEIIAIAKNELEKGNAISVKTEFTSVRYLCQNIVALANQDRKRITNSYISKCHSISNLETELDNNPDGDIYFAFKLYQKYKEQVLAIIDHVEQMNQPESEATRVISTTHALKGREWDTIVISTDYLYLLESPRADIDDELCVLYVALTRARKKAYIPYGLKKYFSK